MLFVGRPHCLDLFYVIFHVNRLLLHHSAQRQQASLNVHPCAQEGALRKVLQQFVVFSPQPAKCFNRLLNLPLPIVQIVGPRLLVESSQRRALLGQDQADPHRDHNLRVG